MQPQAQCGQIKYISSLVLHCILKYNITYSIYLLLSFGLTVKCNSTSSGAERSFKTR